VTRKNPFDSDVAFFSLPLRTKVEILNDLCDFRLDADDIAELLKVYEGIIGSRIQFSNVLRMKAFIVFFLFV